MDKLALKSDGTIDKRHKNGNKIDLVKLIELRDVKRLSWGQIGKLLDYTAPYCHKAYHEFKKLLPNAVNLNTYRENRVAILDSVEMELIKDLSDEDKRKKASLNNTAYAMGQISQLRRLEDGKTTSNIGVGVEVIWRQTRWLRGEFPA